MSRWVDRFAVKIINTLCIISGQTTHIAGLYSLLPQVEWPSLTSVLPVENLVLELIVGGLDTHR